MNHIKRLDRASSSLFFMGFIASKIRLIPIYPIQVAFAVISLICYLAGYLLWLSASMLRPHHPRKKKWYGFLDLNLQHSLSATIGAIATTLSLMAIIFPILILPACWLFLLSNSIWLISEIHRYNHPPKDDCYHEKTQYNYLVYASLMTLTALIVATAITITMAFPALALFSVATSTILCTGIGLLAFEYWLKYQFETHPKAKPSHPKQHERTHKPREFSPSVQHREAFWQHQNPKTHKALANNEDDAYSSSHLKR